MAPTIRVDEDVMDKLKELAVEHELVFRTPNEVLRTALGIVETEDGFVQDSIPANSTNGRGSRPHSRVPRLQKLMDQLLEELDSLLGSPLNFSLTKSGRWVSRPQNFVTVKPQERKQDIALTVYGKPRDFADLNVDLDIKPDRASYSRFNVDDAQLVEDAVGIVRRARDLWRDRGSR